MRKRKPATALKHISKPKIVTKAQRAKQAVVRSPKNSDLRSATESSIKSRPDRHNDSSQRASLILSPATLTHDDSKQKTTVTDSKTEFVRSSATANAGTYQAKLLEIAQANMQFALEFSQKFATIKSPVEFLRVMEEFTSKRIAMFRKHSKEWLSISQLARA
jgi:hypothetical protein